MEEIEIRLRHHGVAAAMQVVEAVSMACACIADVEEEQWQAAMMTPAMETWW